MKQPELGNKIIKLRKQKGLTQEELAEKCNLNLRTIQRIETNEVSPRSFTVKIIFDALDYDFFNSQSGINRFNNNFENMLKQFQRFLLNAFNLKTNKMKKILIATVVILLLTAGIFKPFSKEKSFTEQEFKEYVSDVNDNFQKWFNKGQLDSLMTFYRHDACLLGICCGKDDIKSYNKLQRNAYKFTSITTTSVSICDTIAIEKGVWNIKHNLVGDLSGVYITEWRYLNKEWRIVCDISREH